jgi:hypothetical protein
MFCDYNSVYISHPSMRATCPADLIILDLIKITVNLFGGVKVMMNEELHNLYSSPNIIRMIKSSRMG